MVKINRRGILDQKLVNRVYVQHSLITLASVEKYGSKQAFDIINTSDVNSRYINMYIKNQSLVACL